jgi:Holliday junction resolvasome RuvABC endonuclease subunit
LNLLINDLNILLLVLLLPIALYKQHPKDWVYYSTVSPKSEYAAVEQVFLNVNPKSTLALGQARGAAITAIVCQAIAVVEFSALEVKKNVVGNGRASKSQVQEMIKRLLSLKVAPGTDASDALAVAICGAHQYTMKQQLLAADLKMKNKL